MKALFNKCIYVSILLITLTLTTLPSRQTLAEEEKHVTALEEQKELIESNNITEKKIITEVDLLSQKEAISKIKVFSKELKQCAEIIGRINRLICYDQIANDFGYITPEQIGREEVILKTFGFWEASKKRNAAGEYVIYLKNDAVEEITSRSGLSRKPTFVIKCKNGNTEAYIDWKTRLLPRNYNSSSLQKIVVLYQMKAGPFTPVTWELSTDRQAIFIPEPVKFIKSMRTEDKLIFEITPPYNVSQIVVHDISGLNEVLKILIDECYNTSKKEKTPSEPQDKQ